jgi:hypothetical protein
MHERKNEDILSFVTGVVERRYFIDKETISLAANMSFRWDGE